MCSDTDTKTKAISFISESKTENEAVNKLQALEIKSKRRKGSKSNILIEAK